MIRGLALFLCLWAGQAFAQNGSVYNGGVGQGPTTWLQGSASTTLGTATTLTGMAAQGAGFKIYIVSVQCFRTDTGSTLAYVTLNDGAASTIPLPAGGGAVISYGAPLVIPANTAAQFTPSSALSSVFCDAQGYKGP